MSPIRRPGIEGETVFVEAAARPTCEAATVAQSNNVGVVSESESTIGVVPSRFFILRSLIVDRLKAENDNNVDISKHLKERFEGTCMKSHNPFMPPKKISKSSLVSIRTSHLYFQSELQYSNCRCSPSFTKSFQLSWAQVELEMKIMKLVFQTF